MKFSLAGLDHAEAAVAPVSIHVSDVNAIIRAPLWDDLRPQDIELVMGCALVYCRSRNYELHRTDVIALEWIGRQIPRAGAGVTSRAGDLRCTQQMLPNF